MSKNVNFRFMTLIVAKTNLAALVGRAAQLQRARIERGCP
jgi:hypothetical protein